MVLTDAQILHEAGFNPAIVVSEPWTMTLYSHNGPESRVACVTVSVDTFEFLREAKATHLLQEVLVERGRSALEKIKNAIIRKARDTRGKEESGERTPQEKKAAPQHGQEGCGDAQG